MPDDSAAELFQHYRVLRRADGSLHELGRGAMGVTYKAIDTNLDALVALKVINAQFTDNPNTRARFIREAKAAASLRHPNVASVFHLGQDAQSFFYTMEFIAGETLEAFVRRIGPVPWQTALPAALQIARALMAAHEKQLVHRDIKPANLMLVPAPGEDLPLVKLIDFGLAKSLVERGGSVVSVSGSGFVGTPLYASPEQCEEIAPDCRSDIYSLGITLWYTLTGLPPFLGNLGRVFSQHLNAPPPWEKLPASLPEPVRALLAGMLAKDREDRPQTPADLHADIKACLRAAGGGSEAPTGPQVGRDFRNAAGAEMVWIAPGSFTMGSPASEEGRSENETPHRVTLTQGFWLGKHEVTQALYEDLNHSWVCSFVGQGKHELTQASHEAVTGANPSGFKESGPQAPVEYVGWYDAKAFCRKLTERERQAGRLPAGYEYRLPTETQWEYACRADAPQSVFGIGDGKNLSSAQANFDGYYPYDKAEKGPNLEKTAPVGSYAPNGWGLCDMNGNVYEWCEDWYGDYPAGSVTDPTGPKSGSLRVIRGGGWSNVARYCRAASRSGNRPDYRDYCVGFRLALVPSGQ